MLPPAQPERNEPIGGLEGPDDLSIQDDIKIGVVGISEAREARIAGAHPQLHALVPHTMAQNLDLGERAKVFGLRGRPKRDLTTGSGGGIDTHPQKEIPEDSLDLRFPQVSESLHRIVPAHGSSGDRDRRRVGVQEPDKELVRRLVGPDRLDIQEPEAGREVVEL